MMMLDTSYTKETYFYSGKYLIPVYTAGVVGLLAFSFLPFYLLGYVPRRPTPMLWNEFSLYGRIIIVLNWLMPLLLLCFTFVRARPTTLCRTEIFNTLLGHTWQRIAWNDVRRIEKHEYYDAFFSRNRTLFRVFGPHTRIGFDDGVRELPKLLTSLNRRIFEYHIPVYFVERGRDSNGRRKVIRRTEIQQLS